MKVFPFKVLKADNTTIVYKEDRGEELYDKFHQHDEIQISYVEKGNGRLLVGDRIYPYSVGEIFVFGENLPHVFYVDDDAKSKSIVKTIYFTKEMLGRDILQFAEFGDLSAFFDDIKLGIVFSKESEKIIELFFKIEQEEGLKRIIGFFDLLQTMQKNEYRKLASFLFTGECNESEGRRMNNVMLYTRDNFMKNITLEEIAEVANMNKNAFCRFFKQRTNKTYFQFLIENRIERASRNLAQNQDATIQEIAEMCGFNNLSNFNRKFKEIKGVSPHAYRKSLLISSKNLSSI